MAFLGGIFGGGKKVEPVTIDPRTVQRQQVDAFLANFLNTYGSQYKPGQSYDGKLTAPLGGIEKLGIEKFLMDYLNEGTSQQTMDARGLLNSTIKGGFDPGTSDYYKAFRDVAGYNRNQAITNTNADLGARNKFFSSEAVSKYGDINAQTSNALNLAMADLADKERTRSMLAVPQALDLEKYLSGIPLQKAGAATTIGAIPRTIEQQDLEAQYQDFLRKQKELGAVVSVGSGVSSATTSQGYPNPTLQSGDNGLMSFLSPLLASAAGPIGTAVGGAGASAIGGLMSFLPALFCWVAAEIFGGWNHPKTEDCRYFIGYMAPSWFRELYMKHGEEFAAFIKDKPVLKALIRPLFELFAVLGKLGQQNEMEAIHGNA